LILTFLLESKTLRYFINFDARPATSRGYPPATQALKSKARLFIMGGGATGRHDLPQASCLKSFDSSKALVIASSYPFLPSDQTLHRTSGQSVASAVLLELSFSVSVSSP
jgi:hypothetical protein